MTQTEKKKIIEKLTDPPKTQKRLFWAREIKSLNILLESYPVDSFWKGLSFPKKLDSLILLRSGYYADQLKKKYNRFNYKIPARNNIELGEKTGEDYKKENKPKNIKEFLS